MLCSLNQPRAHHISSKVGLVKDAPPSKFKQGIYRTPPIRQAGPRWAGGETVPCVAPPHVSAAGTGQESDVLLSATSTISCLGPNTHERLFGTHERRSRVDPRFRAQRLWDEGMGRRNYDIVFGKRPCLKTQQPERPEGRLSHPSQQSLERGRNIQGSL